MQFHTFDYQLSINQRIWDVEVAEQVKMVRQVAVKATVAAQAAVATV